MYLRQGLIRVLPDESYRYYSSTEGGFCDWVRQATQMSDGTVVAAGDAGVAYFRNGEIFRTVPLGPDFTNAMVLCMLDEGDGDLLVGSDGDGIAVLRDGVTVQRVNESDGLTSGVILRISRCGAADGFYVVTSNGLCYMDRDYNVTPLENFPYSNNYDVWAREDGRVFVLSSAGIFVVNEAELLSGEEDLSYEVLDSKRGLHATLTANSWNYEDEGEVLYLSSGDGVFMINLADYGSAQRSYRMKMSTINLDGVNHVVEKGTDIVVDRGTVRMELFPEIISYSLEDPFVSYKLGGFDSEEIVLRKSSLGSVVYTNLASGRYTFRLCVLNNNREVIEETSYGIVKELEIFDNWWFKVYMLMVGGLAIAWLTWFIARTQIQRTLTFQQKELEFTRQQVKMGNETIIAIAKTVDAKDENTSQHSLRVSEYSVMIGKELGFSDEECENLRKAALLHDLGKIGIPDRVLNKPGRLTDEEYALMKSHVLRGAEILKDFTVVEHVVDGALYHHERYDGKGYVSGLKGEEIPIYGRIIGVADAFDAMTQNRVYRDKLDINFVIEEMERCRGAQFDPEIDDILLRLVREKKIDLSVYERPEEEAEK